MAESSPPPSSSSATAPAAEPGVTEQPGPQSPPPSPPGPEEPLDGADPEVPHPDLAPVAFFCLRQTTSPRNWCIKMVCNPYPLCGGAKLFPVGDLLVTPAFGWERAQVGGSRGTSGHGGRPADVNILEVLMTAGLGPVPGWLRKSLCVSPRSLPQGPAMQSEVRPWPMTQLPAPV